MNLFDALAFFNTTHVVVMHASGTPLRGYAYWIEARYIEAPDYVSLAVKCKALYEEGVAAGKWPALPEVIDHRAGIDMVVKWPEKTP